LFCASLQAVAARIRGQALVEVTASHQLWEASRAGARMTGKPEVIFKSW